jgi:hypothetical protein
MTTIPLNSAIDRKTFLREGGRLCVAGAALVGFVLAIAFVNLHWPYRYRNVEPLLEKVFASKIKIDKYHRTYFPAPGFVADGVTLRRNSAPNLPPVGSVSHLRVEGRWIDLLLLRDRVRLVSADNLHVVIPPVGSAANKEDFPPGSSNDFTGPSTVVEQLDINNSTLDILRVDGGRYSFPIRHLLIGNLHQGETVSYVLDMQNAMPSGRIQAHGSFGPLLANQLGTTPVSGDFTLTSFKLSEIGGISGTFSAVGHFSGKLAGIEGSGQSAIPDFAVGDGRRTALNAITYWAVSALNGDVTLRAVDVQAGRTVIHAEGNVAGPSKAANIDLFVKRGRVEDLLHPFLTSESPVTGAVALHGHASLAAATPGATFFDRLRMDGAFGAPGERFTDPATERNLTAFSQRAQGQVQPEDPAAEPGVISNIMATVFVRNGTAHVVPLTFQVPGAAVHLNGTFDLQSQNVHMAGDLRMQSDLSHVTTGFKSLLLKPLAPFFKKKDAGAVVPIAITGSPQHYKIGQNILPH